MTTQPYAAQTAQNFPAALTIEEFEATIAYDNSFYAFWPLMLTRDELVNEVANAEVLAEKIRDVLAFQAHMRTLAAFANQAVQRLADIAADVVATRTAEV